MIKDKLRLYFKTILFLLPFLVALVFYIVLDPFMVLHHYDDYDHSYVCQNEGAVGWYKYKMYRDKMHYDSFIMGNSCTMAFRGETWKKYIHGVPFRFFGNSESLPDLYLKLAALDKQPGQRIRNLLLIVDYSTFANDRFQDDCMRLMPPEVSHVSFFSYHCTFLQGFYYPNFFVPFMEYYLTGRFKKSMKGVINSHGMAHEGFYNNAVNPHEQEIAKVGENYWKELRQKLMNSKVKWNFEKKDAAGKFQLMYMHMIDSITKKQHTNVKIIISPNPQHSMLNHVTVAHLRRIFGSGNVFDFSRMDLFYSNIHHFYDVSHYRYELGERMLGVIYAPKHDYQKEAEKKD